MARRLSGGSSQSGSRSVPGRTTAPGYGVDLLPHQEPSQGDADTSPVLHHLTFCKASPNEASPLPFFLGHVTWAEPCGSSWPGFCFLYLGEGGLCRGEGALSALTRPPCPLQPTEVLLGPQPGLTGAGCEVLPPSGEWPRHDASTLQSNSQGGI